MFVIYRIIFSDIVKEKIETSTRCHSQQLGIQRKSLSTILKKDLHLIAYKGQLTQELKANDYELHRQCTISLLQLHDEDDNFWQK